MARAVAVVGVAALVGAGLASPAGAQESRAPGGVVTAGMPLSTGGAARCTTGFAVEHATLGDGFLAAGRCGNVGDRAYVNGVAVGVVRLHSSSAFGWLWVDLDDGWTASPELPNGGSISDGREVPVGASVCRIGSTTGQQCGTIVAKNVSVSFPQGTVYGLTQTNVCTEPGYSGGPFVSGNSAQGIAIGGSGNCGSGGTSYFYPVSRIFDEAPDLHLITT